MCLIVLTLCGFIGRNSSSSKGFIFSTMCWWCSWLKALLRGNSSYECFVQLGIDALPVVVAFVRQVLAVENRNKVTWQLVGLGERIELVLVRYGDGLVLNARSEIIVRRLIFVVVVTRLHLRLNGSVGVRFVRIASFVDEASLNGRSLHLILWRSAVEIRNAWELRRHRLTMSNAWMLKILN